MANFVFRRTRDRFHVRNGTHGLVLNDAESQELLRILLSFFPDQAPPAPPDEAGALADMIRELMKDDQIGQTCFTFDQALQIARLHFELKGVKSDQTDK